MKCKTDGGTCGLGGYCAECPHKKPLDRGKVLEWMKLNRLQEFDVWGVPYYKIDYAELYGAINSGRLDVEELSGE